MGKAPLSYELTAAAEQDLREIARYTFREWGEQQALHYANRLESVFCAIADNTAQARSFSNRYPQVRVTQCEHHYVFFMHNNRKKPQILAILHERMDLLSRLKERFAP